MKNILPNDIDLSKKIFMGCFSHYEAEVSAYWIVKYRRLFNNWDSFEYEDINKFYQIAFPQDKYSFNQLIRDGWIEYYDNLYHITHGFIHQLKEYYVTK